jgi:acetyl esterase
MHNSPFEPALYRPEAISPEVKAFNEAFVKRMAGMPSPVSRIGDPNAPSPFPPVPKSARASVRRIESQQGRTIEVRIVPPTSSCWRGSRMQPIWQS